MKFKEWLKENDPQEYQEIFGIFDEPGQRWMKSKIACNKCGGECKPRYMKFKSKKDAEIFGDDFMFAICPGCGMIEKKDTHPLKTIANMLRRVAAL